MGERKNLVYPIPAPDGTKIMPKRQWLWGKERALKALENGELEFLKGKDGEWTVHTKQYLKDENGEVRKDKAFSIVDYVYTQHGTNEIIDLFSNAQIFPFPKPTAFIKFLANIGIQNRTEIILDFFPGSCSTAHAVLDLNKEDGGNRKFICIQLPEKCDEKSEAYKAGYQTIAEIGKERIRRVIKKIKEEEESKEPDLFSKDKPKQDLGFKVFKLQQSNFKIWRPKVKNEEELFEQLTFHTDPVDENAEIENILYELLLKSGVSLTARIEEKEGYYLVNDGEIALMLEKVDENRILLDHLLPKSPKRSSFLTACSKTTIN